MSIKEELAQLLDVEAIKLLVQQLQKLFNIFMHFGNSVTARITSAVEKINSLDGDETVLKDKLQECKKKLQATDDRAKEFEKAIKNIFTIANINEMGITKIKESLKRNDTKPLKSYLNRLQRYLEKCSDSYDKFQKAYQEAEALCRDTSQECNAKKNEAKNRKYAARAVGGGAAVVGVGGVIGGGVAASVAVGLFTFGIGTVVGLAVTSVAAAGTAAVGAGTAVAAGVSSHLLARNFEKIQSTFKGICEDLDEIRDKVTDLGMKMSKLHTRTIVPVSMDRKNVEEELKYRESAEMLCQTFDVMQDEIKSLRKILNEMTTTTTSS